MEQTNIDVRMDEDLKETDVLQTASDEEVAEISKKLMERNAEVYKELAK